MIVSCATFTNIFGILGNPRSYSLPRAFLKRAERDSIPLELFSVNQAIGIASTSPKTGSMGDELEFHLAGFDGSDTLRRR